MNAEMQFYHGLVPDAELSDQWQFSLKHTSLCENCESDDVETHDFVVLELYCPEPGCSCREVVLQVFEVKDHVAEYVASASIDLDENYEQTPPWETRDGITAVAKKAADAVALRLQKDESFFQSLNEHWERVRTAVTDQHRQQLRLARKKRRKLLRK